MSPTVFRDRGFRFFFFSRKLAGAGVHLIHLCDIRAVGAGHHLIDLLACNRVAGVSSGGVLARLLVKLVFAGCRARPLGGLLR